MVGAGPDPDLRVERIHDKGTVRYLVTDPILLMALDDWKVFMI